MKQGLHMWGKTWNSEVWKAIAGELWKAIAGRTSLLYVSLMHGHEWKQQACKGSTRCCTQLTTLHRAHLVSSWRFLWRPHLCKVRVCEELHEIAVSEKTTMYDTHRIMASSLLPPPKFEINFFDISKSWYANPSLQKGSTEFISFLAESFFPLVSSISSLLLHYKQSQDPSGMWQQAFV